MGWLCNLINCDIPCKWECCSTTTSVINNLNRDYFWKSLQSMKKRTYTFQPSNAFVYEKIIYLNNERNVRSIFSIGLDPENEFAVAGLLEIKKTGDTLSLNHKQLNGLLEFLNDYEKLILRSLPVSNTQTKYGLSIHQSQARIYEIYIRGWSINIDEDSLKTLCRMREHIRRLILSLEKMSKNCEVLFLKMLSHFYYGKTVTEAFDLAQINYRQQFFEELIDFHCNCLDKMFIMEIATKFDSWFGICVRYFIATLMLNESARLQTFSSKDWPYGKEYIAVESLAKSGLYYTGSLDNSACAFCGLILHEWESDDNPVRDHYKYKPNCPFLQNHEETPNVCDVGKQNELVELLSILNKEKETRGVDEVDTV